MDRIMGFFGVGDEEAYEEEEIGTEHASAATQKGRGNVVSLHTQKSVKMVLCEPKSYEDCPEIADHLKSHRPVVVNLHLVRRELGVRIIDFLSGTVYALGGSIQKVGKNAFICTPANVDIQGSITADTFQEERT
jgi:cell division inhibitor SepF